METQTISAKVNARLLTKADRLFTGTLEGRIIEILQNARRAGATEVTITQKDGLVTIQDNGCGIQDFQKLLEMGASGWDDRLESAEDPAGVGLFSLAPREVAVQSANRKLVITPDVWKGQPVRVLWTDEFVSGTRLRFPDAPWTQETVEKQAVFTGLEVTVNGKPCAKKRFCSRQSAHYPQLGCRIEVRRRDDISGWHKAFRTEYFHQDVLVNFHGQVVLFDFTPIQSERLSFLVDLTGEPTGLRLMLPARTCMVENDAFRELERVLEQEAYLFFKKAGEHTLSYSHYLRARELGVDLPESKPVFTAGLLSGETLEPCQVIMPVDFPLSRCYRMKREADETETENAHLFAAIQPFRDQTPFVPVEISACYDGYSWAKLPTIEKIRVTLGKKLTDYSINCYDLEAYDRIEMTILTSDGKRFEGDMPIAIRTQDHNHWSGKLVCLTALARQKMMTEDLWYHLGGYSEDGDSFDTQLHFFEEALDGFWAQLLGPEEFLRDKLLDKATEFIDQWEQIILHSNGAMTVYYTNHTLKEVTAHPEIDQSTGLNRS